MCAEPAATDGTGAWRFIHMSSQQLLSLYVVNKSGGLIYTKDLSKDVARVDLNDSLRLASIWWVLHHARMQHMHRSRSMQACMVASRWLHYVLLFPMQVEHFLWQPSFGHAMAGRSRHPPYSSPFPSDLPPQALPARHCLPAVSATRVLGDRAARVRDL